MRCCRSSDPLSATPCVLGVVTALLSGLRARASSTTALAASSSASVTSWRRSVRRHHGRTAPGRMVSARARSSWWPPGGSAGPLRSATARLNAARDGPRVIALVPTLGGELGALVAPPPSRRPVSGSAGEGSAGPDRDIYVIVIEDIGSEGIIRQQWGLEGESPFTHLEEFGFTRVGLAHELRQDRPRARLDVQSRVPRRPGREDGPGIERLRARLRPARQPRGWAIPQGSRL